MVKARSRAERWSSPRPRTAPRRESRQHRLRGHRVNDRWRSSISSLTDEPVRTTESVHRIMKKDGFRADAQLNATDKQRASRPAPEPTAALCRRLRVLLHPERAPEPETLCRARSDPGQSRARRAAKCFDAAARNQGRPLEENPRGHQTARLTMPSAARLTVTRAGRNGVVRAADSWAGLHFGGSSCHCGSCGFSGPVGGVPAFATRGRLELLRSNSSRLRFVDG